MDFWVKTPNMVSSPIQVDSPHIQTETILNNQDSPYVENIQTEEFLTSQNGEDENTQNMYYEDLVDFLDQQIENFTQVPLVQTKMPTYKQTTLQDFYSSFQSEDVESEQPNKNSEIEPPKKRLKTHEISSSESDDELPSKSESPKKISSDSDDVEPSRLELSIKNSKQKKNYSKRKVQNVKTKSKLPTVRFYKKITKTPLPLATSDQINYYTPNSIKIETPEVLFTLCFLSTIKKRQASMDFPQAQVKTLQLPESKTIEHVNIDLTIEPGEFFMTKMCEKFLEFDTLCSLGKVRFVGKSITFYEYGIFHVNINSKYKVNLALLEVPSMMTNLLKEKFIGYSLKEFIYFCYLYASQRDEYAFEESIEDLLGSGFFNDSPTSLSGHPSTLQELKSSKLVSTKNKNFLDFKKSEVYKIFNQHCTQPLPKVTFKLRNTIPLLVKAITKTKLAKMVKINNKKYKKILLQNVADFVSPELQQVFDKIQEFCLDESFDENFKLSSLDYKKFSLENTSTCDKFKNKATDFAELKEIIEDFRDRLKNEKVVVCKSNLHELILRLYVVISQSLSLFGSDFPEIVGNYQDKLFKIQFPVMINDQMFTWDCFLQFTSKYYYDFLLKLEPIHIERILSLIHAMFESCIRANPQLTNLISTLYHLYPNANTNKREDRYIRRLTKERLALDFERYDNQKPKIINKNFRRGVAFTSLEDRFNRFMEKEFEIVRQSATYMFQRGYFYLSKKKTTKPGENVIRFMDDVFLFYSPPKTRDFRRINLKVINKAELSDYAKKLYGKDKWYSRFLFPTGNRDSADFNYMFRTLCVDGDFARIPIYDDEFEPLLCKNTTTQLIFFKKPDSRTFLCGFLNRRFDLRYAFSLGETLTTTKLKSFVYKILFMTSSKEEILKNMNLTIRYNEFSVYSLLSTIVCSLLDVMTETFVDVTVSDYLIKEVLDRFSKKTHYVYGLNYEDHNDTIDEDFEELSDSTYNPTTDESEMSEDEESESEDDISDFPPIEIADTNPNPIKVTPEIVGSSEVDMNRINCEFDMMGKNNTFNSITLPRAGKRKRPVNKSRHFKIVKKNNISL